MTRNILAVTAIALLAAVGTASADLINYYDFETNALDTGGLYSQANGHDVATNITTGGTVNFVAAPAGRSGTVASINNATPGQLLWTANDPDIALGSNFTVEFWAYSDNWANTTTQPFIVANNYNISLVNNHNWGSGTISTTVNGSGASASPRYATGSWLHMALVVNGAAGTFTHYVNPGGAGEVVISGALAAGAGTTNSLYLSNLSSGYGGAMTAWIDDMAMWNTALDYATLSAHTTAGNPQLTVAPPTPTHHAGDINEDGTVDLQDFGTLKDNFGMTAGATWVMGDVTGDGGVDLQDFGILKDHFGHTNGDSPINAVPEPATMSLLALAALGLTRRRATR